MQPRPTADHRAWSDTASTHLEESAAPFSSRSPPRRNSTGSWRRSGRCQPRNIAHRTLAHHHRPSATTYPSISPKAGPSARTKTPPAVPRPNQRFGISPGEVGGRERRKTNHDGAPKEVGAAKRRRRRRDRQAGLGSPGRRSPSQHSSQIEDPCKPLDRSPSPKAQPGAGRRHGHGPGAEILHLDTPRGAKGSDPRHPLHRRRGLSLAASLGPMRWEGGGKGRRV
jgi:hypothetical protein